MRCAIEVQNGLIERNAGVLVDRRIEFRIGIHVGEVVEESDGDLIGDGVNIAARLEGVAKPGAICLSEQAYRQIRGRLETTAVHLGLVRLKNIAEPIRVFSLDVGQPAQANPAPPAAEKRGPPRLFLVVLPFANIGGDPEQEYFVDGVTRSLTADLSRISGAFVIARNTAFAYKGKAVDLQRIGRELNVRYVLEGSVQRGGDRMRVNVQLIDAETGSHLWAERFDKPMADLFTMQDEIVSRLANELRAEIVAAEARRAERTANPDAVDLHFQGLALINSGLSPETMAKARSLYERALELDPGYVNALISLSNLDWFVVAFYMTDDPAPMLARAEARLMQALAAEPNNPFAHWIMGLLLCASGRVSRGIEEYERALALDPNLAGAHACIGGAKIFIGRAEETEAQVLEALRLSPRDPFAGNWLGFIGMAKTFLGEYEQALSWLRRSIDAARGNPARLFYLAVCLAKLGRLDEARQEVKAGLALDPKFTIARFRAGAESDNAAFLAQRERVIEGMRLAGVPEGGT